MTKSTREHDKAPNPFVMAVLTATMAGFFAVVGSYYSAKFQGTEAVLQKQLEYRVKAYESFIEADRHRPPSVSRLLSIGAMADHLGSDGEIQTFGDQSAALLKKSDLQDIHSQLSSDFNLLRLHGSARVGVICDDILRAWLLRDEEIRWRDYSEDVQAFHTQWKAAQTVGIAYGWKEKISGDERLLIVSVSKLRAVLVGQLRSEMQRAPT